MPSFRIYDHEHNKELLPEEDSRDEVYGYSTPEEALAAYREHFGALENFYQEDKIRIQELERIGWLDIQNLPSRREMIERAEAEAFQQLEEEIDEN